MDGRVRDWLQQEEMLIPHRSTQWLHRKSADIYSIRDGSDGLPMHISVAPDHRSPPSNRYPKTFSLSDSSLIPFAEPKAIDIEWMKKQRSLPKDDKRHVEVTILTTPDGETFPRIDGRRTKDFQRRPRRKTRDPHQEKSAKAPEEKRETSVTNKKKLKDTHPKGDALINDYSVDYLTKDRLTLRPSHRLGIFKKGRASNPVKKGLPDLAFSEMKFLDGKYFNSTIDETTTSKRKRDCQGQRSENEIFSYFNPSKRRPRNLKSDTMTTPRYSYPGPRKRRRRGSHSLDVGSLELFVPASPSRSSPCNAMVEALRRKGVYFLPTNQSSRESNSGSNLIQPSVAGDSDSDVDHSEYYRQGFQTRFKADTKDPTDSLSVMGCETTTRTSTDSHTASRLEVVKDKCNCRSEGGLTRNIIRTEDVTTNTKAVIKQISGAPNPIVVPKRTPASRRKCTPEPPEIKKGIPDSSSPLAALLRVCADSPTTLAAQKNHVLTNDQKFRQDTRASTVIIPPDGQETRQLQRNYQQNSGGASRPLDVPEIKASTQFELVGQGWNDPRTFNDCDVLTGDLCAGYGGNSLYPGQQGEAGRGRGFRDQVTHCHSNDQVSDNYLCTRAAYNQDLGSPGMVSEMPGEYIYEGSQLKFEEDLFTEVPSDYAQDNRYTWRHTSRDWNEGRQTADFGQSCAVVGLQQAVDIGYYPIQGDGYEYVEHNKHELENETNTGPTRNNFWRRHRLG